MKRDKKNFSIIEKFILVFTKAQFSALIGGVIDYGLMVFFTEFFKIHYTIAICIGGIVGAIINFTLNKYWAFKSKNYNYKYSLRSQLFKFTVTALNSIVLKSSGTFLLTSFLKIDYKISRIIVDLIVSIFFNFTLQNYWVFKKKLKQ